MNDTKEILKKYPKNKSYLVEILHEIQMRQHYISNEAMQEIASYLSIQDVEVDEVITFYDALYRKQQGKYEIALCKIACCKIAGQPEILETIENHLNIKAGQTTTDGKFSIKLCECIGMCDQAPAMLINGKAYGNLTKESVINIIKQHD